MVCQKAFSHIRTVGISRHWCPLSQRYAGGDALLNYLNRGWEVHDEVYYEEYWHGGARRVLIFYFVLANNGQCVTMRVLGNPFIERLMRELQVEALPTAVTQARVRQPRRVVHQLH